MLVTALGANRDMPTKGGGAAVLDGRHHFELRQVQVSGVISAIRSTMGAEDIRDLQLRSRHEGWV